MLFSRFSLSWHCSRRLAGRSVMSSTYFVLCTMYYSVQRSETYACERERKEKSTLRISLQIREDSPSCLHSRACGYYSIQTDQAKDEKTASFDLERPKKKRDKSSYSVEVAHQWHPSIVPLHLISHAARPLALMRSCAHAPPLSSVSMQFGRRPSPIKAVPRGASSFFPPRWLYGVFRS